VEIDLGGRRALPFLRAAGPPRLAPTTASYWMQASQREGGNHALEFALELANEAKLPLLVAFCLTDAYPGANLRHYAFMARGLADVARRLEDRGVAFEVFRGTPPEPVARLAAKAAFVVMDAGHMRVQREWREKLAGRVVCPLYEVEANLVVPVDVVSEKE
jgi:deoxyribodipyrimidine photo-lyase